MSDTVTLPEEKTETKEKTKRQPPYHVILLNDDDHTFEYVILMLQALFGHPVETGYQMAVEVHTKGRVIVDTTSRERAELKQEQIHAYGPDPRLPRCKGSMSAVIEPAE
jgi:ATP-dependent Clp protease adaptor protein ClpS